MLGWQINIYQQNPSYGRTDADYIGHWITGLGGTDWLDALVKSGQGMLLYSNGGYPFRYAVKVSDLLSHLPDQPTPHKGPPLIGEDYYMPTGWRGRLELDLEKLATLKPHEIVIVDAWDQS